MNSQAAQRWQKAGSLVVKIESTLQAINSPLALVSECIIVFGFNKSAAAKIVKSTHKVVLQKE